MRAAYFFSTTRRFTFSVGESSAVFDREIAGGAARSCESSRSSRGSADFSTTSLVMKFLTSSRLAISAVVVFAEIPKSRRTKSQFGQTSATGCGRPSPMTKH